MSIANLRLNKADQQESLRNLKAFMEVSKRIKARKEIEDECKAKPGIIRHNTPQ